MTKVSPPSDPESTASSLLSLTPLMPGDTAELHGIYADAATWRHLPSGRHTDDSQTSELIEQSIASREIWGLGQWAARITVDLNDGLPAGTLVGAGGVTMLDAGAWNLGYRLAPFAWGCGFATAIARAGLDAAHDVRPAAPVTARVLANNPASAAVLEKLALITIWRGASGVTESGTTTGLQRIIYADAPVGDDLLTRLIDLG